MTARPNRNVSWLPYAGLATAIIGMVFQAGVLSARVDRNTDRIAALELRVEDTRGKLDIMNERGARIETKLDFALPKKGEER